MKRNLGARAHYQSIIFIPVGDDHMWFDMSLLNFRHFIITLNHQISFSKTLLHIANINPDLGCQVCRRVRICEIYIFWFIMQNGCLEAMARVGSSSTGKASYSTSIKFRHVRQFPQSLRRQTRPDHRQNALCYPMRTCPTVRESDQIARRLNTQPVECPAR